MNRQDSAKLMGKINATNQIESRHRLTNEAAPTCPWSRLFSFERNGEEGNGEEGNGEEGNGTDWIGFFQNSNTQGRTRYYKCKRTLTEHPPCGHTWTATVEIVKVEYRAVTIDGQR